MRKTKFFTGLFLALAVLALPLSGVFAFPSSQEEFIAGTVTGLTCETDATLGITTFLVAIQGAYGTSQTVRIDELTAKKLGLVTVTASGVADCSAAALAEAIGLEVKISLESALPDKEAPQHPVGAALAAFFPEIADYDSIMAAREDGFGFGVIAQALWMTQKFEGDGDVFRAILEAKESGDYSAFILEDGSTPKNWGQFRKAITAGEKGNLGIVMSGNDNNNGNGNGNGNNKDNGNGNGNGNNKDKDKGNSKDD